MNTLDTFLFGLYPYICLTRFSARQPDPLRPRPVHLEERLVAAAQGRAAALGQQPVPRRRAVPVLRSLCRHADAALRLRAFISAGTKQLLAMTAGGIAGVLGFIGVSLLLHRRLERAAYPRSTRRPATSCCSSCSGCNWRSGWPRAAVGAAPRRQHDDEAGRMGAAHRDLPSGAPELLAEAGWIFKAHMFLGMSIFLIFPFTRLVHVWSGFGTAAIWCARTRWCARGA
jgi:nitrate reductase gamma subunit